MKSAFFSARREAFAVLASVLMVGAQAQTGACPPGWQLEARHDQHSDALALRDYGDDASRKLVPRDGRNLAYLDTALRASRSSCSGGGDGGGVGSTWSLLARQSATLVVSRGALALATDAALAGRPQQDQRWDVSGRYLGFAGGGVEWQAAWSPRPGWTLDMGVQALALRHLRERRVEGQAGFDVASQAYRFDLRSFEAGDRLDFPFQSGVASNGWGLLFSGQLAWQAGAFGARASWHDAGWLRWSRLPQQDAQLASATQAVDADGFVIYRPLIQGLNSQPGRTVRPPLRTRVAVDWRPDARSRLELRLDGIHGYGLLPAVGASREFGDLRLGLTWRSHERRATLALDWRGLSAVVGADRLGPEARSQEIALRYRWPL